jgi:AmmeMemoRadiSam system protein A
VNVKQRALETLTSLARSAVETFVLEKRVIEKPASLESILQQRAACFVSIKTDEGDLRGCIGTIEPVKETLAEELIVNAVSSATRDPRFHPVEASELPHLRYSVDVLSAPEPATFEELDPKIYGVIVEDERATRRGLLLPDLQGVETARKQVEIAARKAGIAPGTPLKLFRFRVERFSELGAD